LFLSACGSAGTLGCPLCRFVASCAAHDFAKRSSATGETLDYVIVQATELKAGRVVRQVNVLDPALD
jgi:hypothetical protein